MLDIENVWSDTASFPVGTGDLPADRILSLIHILETQEKYYLSDLGLRHAVIGYRDNDIAGVLENLSLIHI